MKLGVVFSSEPVHAFVDGSVILGAACAASWLTSVDKNKAVLLPEVMRMIETLAALEANHPGTAEKALKLMNAARERVGREE